MDYPFNARFGALYGLHIPYILLAAVHHTDMGAFKCVINLQPLHPR